VSGEEVTRGVVAYRVRDGFAKRIRYCFCSIRLGPPQVSDSLSLIPPLQDLVDFALGLFVSLFSVALFLILLRGTAWVPPGAPPCEARRAERLGASESRNPTGSPPLGSIQSFFFRFSRVRRNRYESLPVSMMCARSVTRSNSALQSRALGITWVHSENGKLVVRITAAFFARSAITWKRRSAPRSAIRGG
jgi:hypothetical protein